MAEDNRSQDFTVASNAFVRLGFGPGRRWEQLRAGPRTSVWRVTLDDGRSVIAKLYGNDASADQRWTNEVTALAAVEGVACVPSLLGADRRERVVVLEDLGRRPTALDALQSGDSLDELLGAMAEALATFHSAQRPPRHETPAMAHPFGAAMRGAELLRELIAPAGSAIVDEVAAMIAALDPGRRNRRIIQLDTCPDNAMVSRAEGRLIVQLVDFEMAYVGNVALDIASLVIPFPNCRAGAELPPLEGPQFDALLNRYARRAFGAPSREVEEVLRVDVNRAIGVWSLSEIGRSLPGVLDGNAGTDEELRVAKSLRLLASWPTSALSGLESIRSRIG